MKRILSYLRESFRRCLDAPWMLALDALAVNLSFLLALQVRYRVNGTFSDKAASHMTAFQQFAPYYTVLCLLIFIAFRLYGGVWKYAGFNDLNRILGATAISALAQRYFDTT